MKHRPPPPTAPTGCNRKEGVVQAHLPRPPPRLPSPLSIMAASSTPASEGKEPKQKKKKNKKRDPVLSLYDEASLLTEVMDWPLRAGARSSRTPDRCAQQSQAPPLHECKQPHSKIYIYSYIYILLFGSSWESTWASYCTQEEVKNKKKTREVQRQNTSLSSLCVCVCRAAQNKNRYITPPPPYSFRSPFFLPPTQNSPVALMLQWQEHNTTTERTAVVTTHPACTKRVTPSKRREKKGKTKEMRSGFISRDVSCVHLCLRHCVRVCGLLGRGA
jgi:hypothetical protein